jgi:hypothetical protein
LALGHEIALCGRLIKGYGATNERGKDNLLHVLDHLAQGADARQPPVPWLPRARPRWPTMPAARWTPRCAATAHRHGR